MPEFKDGTETLLSYIAHHLKYPKWESDNKIEGTVYVSFVIDKSGKARDPRIIKDVPGAKNFGGEVIRLINDMPAWKPGRNYKKTVDVQFSLPVRFKLS